MKCANCKYEIAETSARCMFCGTPVVPFAPPPVCYAPSPSVHGAPQSGSFVSPFVSPFQTAALNNRQVSLTRPQKAARIILTVFGALLAFITVFWLLTALASCFDTGGGQTPNNPDANIPRTTGMRTLVDNSYVTITFAGTSYSYADGVLFDIVIENRSATRIWLYLDNVWINGERDYYAAIDNNYIFAGATYAGSLYFERVSGLTELADLTGVLYIYDSSTSERLDSFPVAYSYRVVI